MYISGTFTPTINGTYLLSVNVIGNKDNGDIVIQRNGMDTLCHTWLVNGPNRDPVSCTVAVHLDAGDSVHVMAGTTEPVGVGGVFRHFSGFIVNPD